MNVVLGLWQLLLLYNHLDDLSLCIISRLYSKYLKKLYLFPFADRNRLGRARRGRRHRDRHDDMAAAQLCTKIGAGRCSASSPSVTLRAAVKRGESDAGHSRRSAGACQTYRAGNR
jgi:hypothetical protein